MIEIMKKKIIGVIVTIAVVAIIIALVIGGICLYNKKEQEKNPNFLAEQLSNIEIKKRADLESLPTDYNYNQSIIDGCFTIYINQAYNYGKLENFPESVN